MDQQINNLTERYENGCMGDEEYSAQVISAMANAGKSIEEINAKLVELGIEEIK